MKKTEVNLLFSVCMQLPSISWVTDENQNTTANPWASQANGLPHQHQSTEAIALENFRLEL